MEKIQIYYYTRTGRSESIAKQLAIKYDVNANKINDNQNWNGVKGFIKGGAKAAKNEIVEIDFRKLDDNKYIVLVCPVWAGKFPPAVNSFFTNCRRENILLIPTSLKSRIKDRDGFKQIIDLIGKDIDSSNVEIQL